MDNYLGDILDKLGVPIWWDMHGLPRYCEFSPDKVNNIYAEEIYLLEIACQVCRTRFKVSESWGNNRDGGRLSKRVKERFFDYGDPPNIRCCLTGSCVTSEPIKVLEFWAKDDSFEFVRVPKLEITYESE